MRNALLLATALTLASPVAALADVSLWIDDVEGNIGLVDITTGTVTQVHNTGQDLTDIGFIGTQMFGVTFTNLFSINDATGASTQIGGAFSDTGMNALIGSGAALISASNASNNVYNLNPSTAALSVRAVAPFPSAGDLAFNGSTLFESVTQNNGDDALVNVNTSSVVAQFHTTSTPGFTNVFGLATDSAHVTYAAAGTEIYTVNLTTGLMTPVLDYSGHGLFAANGTAFVAENGPPSAIPEPSTWVMMGIGFGLMAFAGARHARKRAPATA